MGDMVVVLDVGRWWRGGICMYIYIYIYIDRFWMVNDYAVYEDECGCSHWVDLWGRVNAVMISDRYTAF